MVTKLSVYRKRAMRIIDAEILLVLDVVMESKVCVNRDTQMKLFAHL